MANQSPQYLKRDDRFVIVLSCSFVLGMAVALAVYLFWRVHAGQIQPALFVAALAICPPFVLSVAAGATSDSPLAVFLTAGTIVFANAFLYSGVAAGLYSILLTLFAKRRRS